MSAVSSTVLGRPPPFDRELAGPLAVILAHRPSLTPDLIESRREAGRVSALDDDEIRRGGAFTVDEVTVPGPGPAVPLLVCRPTGSDGPHPVLYNIHGGGMVAGHRRSAELVGELDRAEALQCAVLSVDYRLAPEHPDPAPVEDCYAGLVWLAERGAGLGLDPDRIVLSGNSAGGALAAGVALLARDRGGPPLAGMLLQFPMLDDRCDTVSARQMERVGMWDGLSNRTGWSALLGARRGTDAVSCYAAPARAADLTDLPPAYVEVGSVEALRDEAVAFVSRIWQGGGEAELHVWEGAFHSFDEWVPCAVVSRAAHDARVSWLHRHIATDSPQDDAVRAFGDRR